jgi:hypothetical protein
MNQLTELFFINIVCRKLDTRKAFEMKQCPEQLPKWSSMLAFLQTRCHLVENIEGMKPSFNKPSLQRGSKCANCVQIHYISQCVKFLNLSIKYRVAKVTDLKLCSNCLSSRHTVNDCRSSFCIQCQNEHHKLLHEKKAATATHHRISTTIIRAIFLPAVPQKMST